MDLAHKIKKVRKQNQPSQGELAVQVGIKANHRSRLETGEYQQPVQSAN